MRRITSIDNAIKYFEEGSTKRVSKDSKGEEYTSFIPPKGFCYMKVTYKSNGLVTISQRFDSWQWKDYASFLRKEREKIESISLYCE